MWCAHCRRGLCGYQIAIVIAVASSALGMICGVAAGMPNEGVMIGILHAVVPVSVILDEVRS